MTKKGQYRVVECGGQYHIEQFRDVVGYPMWVYITSKDDEDSAVCLCKRMIATRDDRAALCMHANKTVIFEESES